VAGEQDSSAAGRLETRIANAPAPAKNLIHLPGKPAGVYWAVFRSDSSRKSHSPAGQAGRGFGESRRPNWNPKSRRPLHIGATRCCKFLGDSIGDAILS
jgi:hypothetical protein